MLLNSGKSRTFDANAYQDRISKLARHIRVNGGLRGFEYGLASGSQLLRRFRKILDENPLEGVVVSSTSTDLLGVRDTYRSQWWIRKLSNDPCDESYEIFWGRPKAKREAIARAYRR
jgi:hypothetical protein